MSFWYNEQTSSLVLCLCYVLIYVELSEVLTIGTSRHRVAHTSALPPWGLGDWLLELETKVAEDYAKFYNHGERPY